jgi:hypothetical protein
VAAKIVILLVALLALLGSGFAVLVVADLAARRSARHH